MGQYHVIYNKTKKEYISASSFDEGVKLCEFSTGLTMTGLALLLCNSNGRGGGDIHIEREYDKQYYKPLPLRGAKAELQELLESIQGRWSGDEIVIQGDYATKNDRGFIENTDDYTNIGPEVFRCVMIDSYFREGMLSRNEYPHNAKQIETAKAVEKTMKPKARKRK